jgi:DNA polymerase/3'-5' exonuclease PolX
MDNRTVAERLTAHARNLEREAGNLYRSRAYRIAVQTVLGLDQSLEEVVAKRGRKGLAALPGIGAHLAYTIERLVRTGEFSTMTPDAVPPQQWVGNLTGVGPALTELLRERLGVATVAELEAADKAGRLEKLGLGRRRLEKLRQALAKHQSSH